MTALDANVVLRLLLNDDPAQAEAARRLLERPVFIPLTVLLEVGWVLLSRYGFSRPDISAMLETLLDDMAVAIEAGPEVAWALARYRVAGDLVDLIHLAAAGPADSFTTFDAGVARAVGPDSPVPVETLRA